MHVPIKMQHVLLVQILIDAKVGFWNQHTLVLAFVLLAKAGYLVARHFKNEQEALVTFYFHYFKIFTLAKAFPSMNSYRATVFISQ